MGTISSRQHQARLCYYHDVIRPGGGKITQHTHDYSELVYYIEGNGKSIIGNTSHEITHNTFAFIPATIPHEECHYNETHVIYIGFNTADSFLLPQAGLYQGTIDVPVLSYLRIIVNEATQQKECYDMVIEGRITELLILLQRHQNPSVADNKTLTYAIEYIREYYHQPINLNSLSRDCGYSYDYFQHLMKREIGFSPKQYIMELRLINASRMLAQGLKCKEVAYACGFSDSSQFSRLFRARFGTTPSSYFAAGTAQANV